MKLYTYNNLEAKYIELDKRTLLNLLIAGERKNIYVNFSKDNTNERYYFNRAKDKDIKEFLNPEVEDFKVAINSKDILDDLKNLRIAQPWVIPDSSLTINQGITLDHDIVIGINKDLKLPTVFIDGEEIKGRTELLLYWETKTDKGYPDNKFKIKHFEINNRTHKELKLQTKEDTGWTL